jgi:hypothetical protein
LRNCQPSGLIEPLQAQPAAPGNATMRVLHWVLCSALLLFAATQYNDPDWYYWGLVYLIAAYWSYLAARASERLVSWPLARYGAPISILFFLVGFASLAHTIDSNWIHVEEAREAVGYLICAIATIIAVLDAYRLASARGLNRSSS